jgi:hypothetical protein
VDWVTCKTRSHAVVNFSSLLFLFVMLLYFVSNALCLHTWYALFLCVFNLQLLVTSFSFYFWFLVHDFAYLK